VGRYHPTWTEGFAQYADLVPAHNMTIYDASASPLERDNQINRVFVNINGKRLLPVVQP